MATNGKMSAGGSTRKPASEAKRPAGEPGERFLADDRALLAIEEKHPDGLTSAQVVEAFTGHGVRLSEATFRKWVQLGLLPRSRRVGRKGKHQGSLGLYPPSTVRRIAVIKRLMAESLTTADIVRSLRFRDEVEAIERGLSELFRGFAEELSSSLSPSSSSLVAAAEAEQRAATRLLEQLRKQAGELVRRIGILERRVVEPFERQAKARAFGSGTAGGAGDLL